MKIIKPAPEVLSEEVTRALFPNLVLGIEINGKVLRWIRNNAEDKYRIDWRFDYGDTCIAVGDTESKPNWYSGDGYNMWSVPIYTRRHTKNNGPKVVCKKMRFYRQYPDRSFWVAIRNDYKRAGIVTGRTIIEGRRGARQKPDGYQRDVPFYEFPKEAMTFCDIGEHTIEEFVISHLTDVGIFNG